MQEKVPGTCNFGEQRMRGRRVLVAAGSFVVVLAAGVFLCSFLLYRAFDRVSRPVTDVGEYGRVLGEWKEFAADIVWHFPEAVPADAEDVDFYFFPGVLQADSRLELRFRTDRDQIKQYFDKFSGQAAKMTYGAALVHQREESAEADVSELGEDYVVMHFDADPDNIPEHGKRHGVIISREKLEIIFWAEW